MKSVVIYILLIIIGSLLLLSQRPIKTPSKAVGRQTALEQGIMSIRELQQALNDKGHSRYKCEIDGRMGPQTLKAWNNYICDRQARLEFE